MLAPPSRLRVALMRPGARLLIKTPWIRRWLARTRSAAVEGHVLDQEVAALFKLDDWTAESDLRGLSPVHARRRVAESAALVEGTVPEGVRSEKVEFAGPTQTLAARLYVPRGLPAPSPGLVFVHGGGFVTGNIDTHDGVCRRLAFGAGIRVISIGYRLAPEHRFPAAVDDALAGFRFCAESAAELGIDPDRLAVGGDSAGGNLSAVVTLKSRGERHRPALQVLCYPALDATCSRASHQTFSKRYYLTSDMVDWYYGHYLGADAELRKHPDVSPLHAPDLDGAAPALVYAAHFDPLRDEAVAYAERLGAAGVRVTCRTFPTLPHGLLTMTGLCHAAMESTELVAREIGAALRA